MLPLPSDRPTAPLALGPTVLEPRGPWRTWGVCFGELSGLGPALPFHGSLVEGHRERGGALPRAGLPGAASASGSPAPGCHGPPREGAAGAGVPGALQADSAD